MRVLLIRHGETVHNVAGVYAGITDSALTNHGVLQANRLGAHLSATGVKISHIFASDLQRAFKTAEAVRLAQSQPPAETVRLEALREQSFGFYEGKHLFERPKEADKSGKEAHRDTHRSDPGFKDVESKDSMRIRSDAFIDDHLIQLLHQVPENSTVVVVAHGIILSHLWRAFLKRFSPGRVSIEQGIETSGNGFSLEHLGGWSNTGYLDLEIKIIEDPLSSEEMPNSPLARSDAPDTIVAEGLSSANFPQKLLPTPPLVLSSPHFPCLLNMSLVVKAVNSRPHLVNLKKTRGGIGSLEHDSKQKTVDSFFKKRRLE
ncbi:phosphoglycerate mutase family protein [Diplocarpon rosae]|nr:phosphoglycerate mutase family protein [Diplocarpon rosae]